VGAHTGGRSRSFTASVPAADHHNIESVRHQSLKGRLLTKARGGVKNIGFGENVSRETFGKNVLWLLFSNTEVPENHVEDIFNVDSTRQSAKCTSRNPKLLGEQILAV
jgi:hypothetical protein